jgi:hypothetical protein
MKLKEMHAGKHVKFLIIFFFVVCLSSVLSVILRKSGYSLPELQNLMVLILLMVLGLFGWLSVKRYKYSLIKTILLGMILSSGSHWTLPLFHEGWEILLLIIVNSAIFSFVAFLGGCFAVLFHKVIEAKKRNNDN